MFSFFPLYQIIYYSIFYLLDIMLTNEILYPNLLIINLDFPKILATIPNYSTIPKPMKISRTSKNGGFSIDAVNNI